MTILNEYYSNNKTPNKDKVKQLAFELYSALNQNRGFDINVGENSEIDLLEEWVRIIESTEL